MASGGGLEEARRRGRWKTPGALSRYTKVHALIKRRAELPKGTMEVGRKFWNQPAAQLREALEGSVACDTPLAKLLIEKLARVEDDEVKVFDSGLKSGSEPVGKPSAAHRARARRRT